MMRGNETCRELVNDDDRGREREIMKSPIRLILDSFDLTRGKTKYSMVGLRTFNCRQRRMASRFQGAQAGRFAPSLRLWTSDLERRQGWKNQDRMEELWSVNQRSNTLFCFQYS